MIRSNGFILLLILSWSLFSLPIYSQNIPSSFTSEQTLKDFLSCQPQFKSEETGVILTLTYQKGDYISYLNGKQFEWFDVRLNPDHPTMALILMRCPGVGTAVIQLNLNNLNPKLLLFPGESEGLVSYDMKGLMLNKAYGITDRVTRWTDLTLESKGFTFTPVNYEPKPKLFNFTRFNSQKYTWDPIQEKFDLLPDVVKTDFNTCEYKLNKEERTAMFMGFKNGSTKDDFTIPTVINVDGLVFKVNSIGRRAFMNAKFNSVTIPETIISIGEEAFLSASIKNIYIKSSTAQIGDGAFSGITGLKYIEYPFSYVPNNCFEGCPDLKCIDFTSEQLNKVWISAFKDCPQLSSITIKAQNPPITIDSEILNSTPIFKVYTPKDTQKAYKTAAGWKTFKIKKSQNGSNQSSQYFISNQFRLGLEFIDFALGQADKAGNNYVNLDLGLRLRFGDWEDPLQFGIGVRAGIGMVDPYDNLDSDRDIQFAGKLFMPIDLQIKYNLLYFTESTFCFMDAKLIYNALKDNDFQRPMAWALGLGIAGSHWEWNLYYKKEFGKYTGKYVAFKEYIPFGFGTTVAYYFNLN